MRRYFLIALCIMASVMATAQTSFMPPSWRYDSKTKVYSQSDGLKLYKHEMSSQHFDVYYGIGYGTTPPEKLSKTDALYVDVKDLLEKAETFFDININKLKFADLSIQSKLNEYKMIICILYDKGWTATGSGYDNQIGALWVTPSTCHPVGQTIAHEIGHAFQYQVYCDLGGKTGFRTAIGNGSTFWEQTAQWQSVMSYPNLKWDQSWGIFKNTANYAMTNEWMRYQSYWWHYYLAEKYGVDIIGRIWRYNPTKAGDPNESLMELLGIDSNELYMMYFDYAMKMATIDLDVARKEATPYIGTYTYNYISLGGTKYQVAYSSCPQSTGFNVIKLSVPSGGNNVVSTEFTSLKSPVKIAEGDPVVYINEDSKYVPYGSDKTYYNINTKYNSQRGYRLGYVALMKDGSRRYLYEDSLYCAEGGVGNKAVKIEAEVPEGTQQLYLVVVPAPREYIQHKWNDDISDDDQWPYTVEFTNTNIAGAPIISDDAPICNATFTYDVSLPRSTEYGWVDVRLDDDAKANLGTALQMSAADIAGKLVAWSSTEPKDGQMKFYAVNPSTGKVESSGSTANGYGHWFDASGKVIGWGNSAYVYSEFDPSSCTFTVGQYPSRLTVGKTYTLIQALKYTRGTEKAMIKFVFNITCTSSTSKASFALTSFEMENKEANSINPVKTDAADTVVKKLSNGQVIIMKNDKSYSVSGRAF